MPRLRFAACAALLACFLVAGVLSALGAQDAPPVEGYGPWEFGMRHFEIANFDPFGPYLPVESTGGLETRNGEFDGEPTNVSFVFDDDGLRYVQIWAYEGSEIDDMMRALHRVYAHMSSRYGDLMYGPNKVQPGLNLEELAVLTPDVFLEPLSPVTEEQARMMDQRSVQQSVQRIELEPIWQPQGARIVGQVNRVEALGGAHVMLYYRRGADWEPEARTTGVQAETGPAEVISSGAHMQATLEPAERYAMRSVDSALVARYPELSGDPDAYVVTVPLGEARTAIALVGNADDGFELRALPAAVSEPDDLRFRHDGDRHALEFEVLARERAGDELATYPVALRFEVRDGDEPGTLRVFPIAMRHGVARLGDHDLAFAVSGDGGIFNERGDSVFFDLDGDGELDQSARSSEHFRIVDGYFTLDGTNWEFVVDRLGDRVSFFPLDDSFPARVELHEGATAPDFEFVDLEGATHRLSDYRGKVVLLDFWGAWCPPCRGEAPHMVEAYERFAEEGFEIIGIDYNETEEQQLAFMQEFDIRWPQTRESDARRPIHDLFRVWNWPTHVLIDEDGAIIKHDPRGEQIVELLEEHFAR